MENQEKVWDKIARPWKEFRNEKLVKEVKKFLKNKKGEILDLGCGSGRNFIRIDGTLYGVDFSKEMLELAKKHAQENNIKVNLTKSHADSLPFESNFFDSAIFIAALHCVPSAEKRENSLKELFRVLKPGAKVLISVWGRNSKRIKNKPKESMIPWTVENKKYQRYSYIYDQKELEDLLKKINFKIDKLWEDENINVIVKKP